jgi:uncharacterized protein (UPF0261 family)
LTHSAKALLIATMDTKGQEAIFIKTCLNQAGISIRIMDAGIRGESPVAVDICRADVASAGGKPLNEVQNIGHEGKALEIMTAGAVRLAKDLYRRGEVQGIIGLGGSMGTTLGTGVMRAFPIGLPKIMISTMASRDTRAFVGTKDLLMLHSVSDLAGINRITRKILRNGAMALAGMLQQIISAEEPTEKPLVFISTLGTTEACAQRIRTKLEEKGYEAVIFHTVGSGGRAMEEMIVPEKISVLIDLSLHEIADNLFGGDYDAGPERGETAPLHGVPTILVPGNIDFLVTGPLENARRLFPNRPYHVHNAAITVVRTARQEMEILAETIAKRCNRARGLLKILVPLGGFSAFDSYKGPLYDPDAPALFVKTLQRRLNGKIGLTTLPNHINDPEFSLAILAAFDELNPISW